ncbi:MAG: hypothetical protein ABFD92_00330 [Planctomycetaceae bacterium]|nr:hypothetical protein [Planctomycetaceae bacterium]
MAKKRKRWPWLIAAAGVAALVAIIVCLFPSADERRATFLVNRMRTIDRHDWSATLGDIPVNDSNGQTFRQAFEALGPKAVPILVQTLEGGCDDQEQEVIFAALRKNGPAAAAAVPYLKSVLEDPNPMAHYQKMQVIETLSAMGDAATPALPAVAAYCQQDQVAIFDSDKEKLAAVLAGFGEPIIPHMIKLMCNGGFQGQNLAYRTVGKIGPAALPRMILLLRNPDPSFHLHAAHCLSYMDSKTSPLAGVTESPAHLAEAIRSDWDSKPADPDKIFWLRAQYLAKLIVANGVSAVKGTAALLDDPDWRMRTFAANTLGRIGPRAKGALVALEKCRKKATQKEECYMLDEALRKIRP